MSQRSAFAVAINTKVKLLTTALTRRQRAAVLSSISVDIRKYCDAAGPVDLVPRVSQRAAQAAAPLGIDLCQQTWQDQPAFDAGRSVFHLEHVVPVVDLRARCLRAGDEAGVAEVLADAQVAWIVKGEDRELTRLGFRSRRGDPEHAYAQAGIILQSCPHG